jgi:hypothetical protein
MKRIIKLIAVAVLTSTLCGCASGFTFDGVHYIGRSKDYYVPGDSEDTGFVTFSFTEEHDCSER